MLTHLAQPSRRVYKTRTIDADAGDGRWLGTRFNTRRDSARPSSIVDTGARSSAVRRWSSGGGPTASSARSVAADGIAWSRPARFISAPRARRQTSLTAGPIFAATKLSLRSWFRALYHLTQSKQGISSLELGRRLGVTQSTAWTVKHKLEQVMMERDAKKRLIGRLEMDDAYLGGQRSGGKRGRGAAGKTPIVATVETTAEGRPVRLKLRRMRGFRRTEIEAFAKRSLDVACTVVSDGLSCFRGVTAAGCTHQPIRTGSGRKAVLAPAFKWVNTALGNIKTAIVGTYTAIRDKHVPRYLAEFEYRFNRRHDLAAILPRLGWAAVRTPPMPYRLLKLAEFHA